MKSVVGRARLIWGASEGELAICAILVGIAITIYLTSIPATTAKVGETEVLMLAARNRIYWAELWATEGRRESGAAVLAPPDGGGRYTVELPADAGDGSATFQFTRSLAGLEGGELTIRPSVSTSGSGAMVWLCGRKPAPRGFVALGQDRTDV